MTARSTTDGEPTTAPTGERVPPGPDGYPLVGNVFDIMRRPLEFLEGLRPYGDVVRYQFVGTTGTTLLHPDYVEQVLVERPERFDRYLFDDRGLAFAPAGLLFTHGEQWQQQRKVLQSGFTMDRIRSYAETMQGYAADAADSYDEGEEIALNRAFSELTLRILSKALFDVEVDPDGEDEAIIRAARVINEQASNTYATVVPDWVPTPANRRYRRAISDYRDRVAALIDERRTHDEQGNDLLSMLVAADSPLSETEIRDNLITFTFAGHETTSLALTYTVLLLAQHDDIRADLDEELERVVGDDRPGFKHAMALDGLDRVIRESMRLYPPAHIIFRTPTEDVEIGGYDVPEGSIVSLPQYAIHRDERFYDDPERFRPERWTDGFEDDLPDYAYFPFGGGPRHCIGMRFAMLELKLVLATFLRRFEFDLLSDPEPDLAPAGTLRPADDIRVRVRER